MRHGGGSEDAGCSDSGPLRRRLNPERTYHAEARGGRLLAASVVNAREWTRNHHDGPGLALGVGVRDQPQLRPVPLGLEDRRLPLPWQVVEAVGVEQRLVELAALPVIHVHERRVADDLLDAAAEVGRSPLAEPTAKRILGGRMSQETS